MRTLNLVFGLCGVGGMVFGIVMSLHATTWWGGLVWGVMASVNGFIGGNTIGCALFGTEDDQYEV